MLNPIPNLLRVLVTGHYVRLVLPLTATHKAWASEGFLWFMHDLPQTTFRFCYSFSLSSGVLVQAFELIDSRLLFCWIRDGAGVFVTVLSWFKLYIEKGELVIEMGNCVLPMRDMKYSVPRDLAYFPCYSVYL